MSDNACQETVEHSGHQKFFSAVFYAGSSLLITVVNKTVLTSFRYVALGRAVAVVHMVTVEKAHTSG